MRVLSISRVCGIDLAGGQQSVGFVFWLDVEVAGDDQRLPSRPYITSTIATIIHRRPQCMLEPDRHGRVQQAWCVWDSQRCAYCMSQEACNTITWHRSSEPKRQGMW